MKSRFKNAGQPVQTGGVGEFTQGREAACEVADLDLVVGFETEVVEPDRPASNDENTDRQGVAPSALDAHKSLAIISVPPCSLFLHARTKSWLGRECNTRLVDFSDIAA